MPAPEIQPFADEHLDAAAALLAERHRRHRHAEPALPARFEDPAAAREEIEAAWRIEGASGAVAFEGGRPVGYLLGQRREDAVSPHMWSFVAGQALLDPALTGDLYRAAAARWVDDGLTRHFVYVPSLDDLVEPWFRLGFGASAALAMRETEVTIPPTEGVTVRQSGLDDLGTVARLSRILDEHLAASPSFAGLPVPTLDEAVGEWRDTWDRPDFEHFLAERGDEAVGHVLLYRRPADLRVPTNSIDLANAATLPSERGSGIGLALAAHALTWAHEHGHPTMVTDWRMTNLEAARFWPRRGFRETFVRLYRSIP